MNIIEEIKQDSAGLLFLKDWLGDGTSPVEFAVAQSRANVCLHTKVPTGYQTASGPEEKEGCPLNRHPNWWERWLSDPIANAIRRQLEIKQRMDLSLPEESNLNMCQPCGCCLKLKVWAPTEHLKRHTSPQVMEKLPNYCWLKKEVA